MLNELNKLPPLGCSEPASAGRRNVRALKRNLLGNSRQQVQAMNPRRKATNLVRGADTLGCQLLQDDGDTDNPVAALLRVQQLAKQTEPVYTVVEEHGQGRRKEFVMEVNCGVRSARGSGCSKKIAKRIAAKEMLDQLDESGVTSAAGGEFIIQLSPSSSEKARKVTFTESKALNENANQIGRQLVPGILLMSPESEWPTPHSPAGTVELNRSVSRSYFLQERSIRRRRVSTRRRRQQSPRSCWTAASRPQPRPYASNRRRPSRGHWPRTTRVAFPMCHRQRSSRTTTASASRRIIHTAAYGRPTSSYTWPIC